MGMVFGFVCFFFFFHLRKVHWSDLRAGGRWEGGECSLAVEKGEGGDS